MHIERMIVGDLETNCYIVASGKEARDIVVVDPGADAEKIMHQIGERTVQAVLLTHGHFDHTGALMAFDGLPIYIHPKDAPMLQDSRLSVGGLLGDDAPRPPATHLYQENDVVKVAGLSLEVMETPGHTMGSVCLKSGKQILTGDTLFDGDYGRTDLPGGSATLMRESLKKLFALHGYTAYPGHGKQTTIR